ncbi:MAG: diacylglycerol/lipid kinase family protein [Thermoplasmata archaeon]|jgi:YegS/Rv2252/BmrU family lipid kinase
MRMFFIINPVAGRGKTVKHWQIYMDKIFSDIGRQDFAYTEYSGHATELARSAVKGGYDAVISVGGDGTLNEVVNGIAGSDLILSMIPLGTGSDFGKTIGIRNLEDFLSAVKSGRTIIADIPLAYFPERGEKRYFINILEVGFGAEVMSFVNRHKALGRYSFILGIFSTLSRMEKFNLYATYDSGDIEQETIEAIIANGRYFGGGMLASPGSSIDDGLLDVHILKPVSRFSTIFQLRHLISGKYIEKGYSLDFSTSKIRIKNAGILVEMDGEVVGKTPVEIDLMKNHLRIITGNI